MERKPLPMSSFGKSTGRPPPPKPPQSAQIVREALLDANRLTAPYVVRPGGADEAELVAEWRIADSVWWEIFAAAGLTKAFKVLMRLDDSAKEVRSVDQEWSVAWRAGVPSASLTGAAFRGQKTDVDFGKAFGFTEAVDAGEIYNYRFVTSEMKTPLQKIVAAHGWIWRSVAFERL